MLLYLSGVCDAQLDLTIVLDSSGSINEVDGGNWDRVLRFSQDIARRFSIGSGNVQIGIVRYSNNGNVEFYLNTYGNQNDLVDAIGRITYVGGTTNTADGLQLMNEQIFQRSNGDRDNVPNVAIVVTDGKANERETDTITQAQNARGRGIRIIAVGVTAAVDETELRGIASTNNDVIRVDDFDLLSNFLDSLASDVCPATPSPGTTPRPVTPSPTTPDPGMPHTRLTRVRVAHCGCTCIRI